jgi:tripartite-type tricarboxylate transporter receptor subunit TctC
VSLPAATSKDIVNKVSADVNWALTQPDVRARLEDQGYTPAPNSPEAFSKFIRAEIAKYATIVRNTGMKLN